jgi:hypothetical protein
MTVLVDGSRNLPEIETRNKERGRPRRWWEDNIKMDFTEIGWGGMD